jgi:hypothetical protein
VVGGVVVGGVESPSKKICFFSFFKNFIFFVFKKNKIGGCVYTTDITLRIT